MRALVAMLCILGLMSNAPAEAAENIGPYETDGSNSVEIVSDWWVFGTEGRCY